MSSRYLRKMQHKIEPLFSEALKKVTHKAEGDSGLGATLLYQIIPLMLVMAAAMYVIRMVCGVRYGSLWITSPSGKTTRELPFYQALRVVRKQGWHLTKVRPVQPPITKWQAFKAMFAIIMGRRSNEEV